MITGNWGSDLSLLVKAANDAGLNVNFYTYYAGVTGTPTALGPAAAGKVFQVSYMHSNMDGVAGEIISGFKAKYPDADWYTGSTYHIYALLGDAMAKAKSTDPVKVAIVGAELSISPTNG